MKIYKRKSADSNYYDMLGTSMLPTLRPGEGLIIDSEIDRRNLQVGDIIIFSSPQSNDKNIVHRIIKISQNGYITCGDNNRRQDDHIVQFETIIGKAAAVRRGDKTVMLSGGDQGYFLHRKLKIKKFSLTYLLKVPSLVSRIIDRSCIFNVFHKLVKFDTVTIKKNNYTEEILLRKNKIIGRKCSFADKWTIKFPYKYFINRKKLTGKN
jgi:signal peptidase I